MISDAGNSYYAATAAQAPAFPQLKGEVYADVAILGGGYTGINSAIELRERGYEVALVEARTCGWGCSGRNGGEMIGGMASYPRLMRHLGESDARIAWGMGVEGLDIVTQRMQRHSIQCDFQRGYLEVAWNRRQMQDLRSAYSQQQLLGYPHRLEIIERDQLHTVIGSQAYVGGMTDEGSGHLHPLNLCIGEAQAAAALGVQIFANSPVTKVVQNDRPALQTTAGVVRAKYIVIAGDAYLEGLVKEFNGYLLPAGSYLIATEPLPESLARFLLPRNHAVCDQNTLLDYYRLSADRRLIFGGRCNHSGRKPRDIKGVLVPRMLKAFPELRGVRIDFEWGGTVSVSLKRIPQLGRLSGNVYYAQGYSGHGIVPTHMSGRLIAEAIAGTAERFDVFAKLKHRRIPGGRWFASPALAIGMSYYRLRDILGI